MMPRDGQRRSRAVQIALLIVLPLSAGAMVWLLRASAELPESGDALRATDVRLVHSPARDPAAVDASLGTPVALPHDWRGNYPHDAAWYLFHVDLEVPPDRLWGVLLPFVEQNARVFLNGRIVGSRGVLDPYPSRFATTPLYFPVPNGLIRPGRNELAILVKSFPPGRGYLGPVLLGPDAHLAPFFERGAFARSSLLWFFASGALAMTFIVGFIAWRRPQEALYRWFALLFLLWTLLAAKSLIAPPVLAPWILDAFGYIVSTWFCAASFLFVFRFMTTSIPVLERAVLAGAILGTAAVVVVAGLAPDWVYRVGPVSTGTQMALGLGVVGVLVRRHYRTRDTEYLLILYAGAIIMIAGTFSFRVSAGAASPVSGQFLLYATPLILGAFVVLLLNRFVRALEAAEHTAAVLEARVDEKSRELARNYEQLRDLERERVLAQERERIMREMHDGIGGQLISSIAQLRGAEGEAGQVRRTLEAALTDLRLMIDSLEDVDGDLNVVLGMLRQRLQPQLEGAGLIVDWRVDELPGAVVSPEVALDLMRIVQEALTNAVRHAGASRIKVTATDDRGALTVAIEDDGRGIDNGTAAAAGRGVAHMHRRAARLNGTLRIERLDPGTRIHLTLPLSSTQPASKA